VPTLLLTGTIAAGKTAIASETFDVLAELATPCRARPRRVGVAVNTELMFKNWLNYRDYGSTHLVLARVLEDRGELDRTGMQSRADSQLFGT
jgi:hypothetical protein